MKTCRNCKLPKPLSEFHKDTHHVDGLKSQCKSCKSTYDAIRSKIKAEKMNADQRKEVIDSLNGAQLKVYAVIPVAQNYDYNTLINGFARTHSTSLPTVQFNKILYELVDSGVVTEKPKGYYSRTVIVSEAQAKPEPVNALKSIKPVEQSTIVLRTRYAGIVDEILRMESQLSNLKLLVSAFAAETDKKLGENSEALEKASKFKAMMKEFAE